VMVGQLSMASAQYIAGYVTKKMTHRLDIRLDGRHPEFARMSLRPGIGALAMHNVASDMMRWHLEKNGDVPTALRYGGKLLPLGRYLRRELRKMVGKNEKAPPATLQTLKDRLSLLRAFAFANDRSVASVFQELNEPYANSLQAKISIGGKRETL